MDKRYAGLPLPQQLALRKKAIEDVLANPQWTLVQAIRHLKTTLRLTSSELAKLAGIGYRTLQDIENGRSPGSVQTMNQVLGVLGLRLGVVSASQSTDAKGANATNTTVDTHANRSAVLNQ
jgi:transcriptional regulator with XRE-family HTH domain